MQTESTMRITEQFQSQNFTSTVAVIDSKKNLSRLKSVRGYKCEKKTEALLVHRYMAAGVTQRTIEVKTVTNITYTK